MVENRKLFYAISLMLLACCQIITMLPHNAAASSESGSFTIETTADYKSTASNNGGNNNAKTVQETKSSETNSNDDSDFLIIAVERRQKNQQQEKQQTIVSKEEGGTWETQENDDSRPTDNIDDLIFLDKRPINQYHRQQQHEKQMHHHHYAANRHLQQQHQKLQEQQHAELRNEQKHLEFHHITMDGDGGSSNSKSNEDDIDSLTDTTYSSMVVVDDNDDDDNDEDVVAAAVADDDDGIPHEIELQPDINEEVTPLNVTPLDLSDFLSLIPATKVKTIVNHYYHNDPEVQRAHAFMSSRDFLMLKQHIIAVPEMSAFLHYLNNSGLDLVEFVTALTNLTSYESANTDESSLNSSITLLSDAVVTTVTISSSQIENTTVKLAETNDIEYAEKQQQQQFDKITPTNIYIQTITNMATTGLPETTIDDVDTITTATTIAKEQLNGLHGLVDSVLDILPQDQILATFFDKLEANEQFSKLVDNIGSPEFAKILNNMQNSMPLRNLIFTLHNNGIYIIRIVDSLKSYFFLGGF